MSVADRINLEGIDPYSRRQEGWHFHHAFPTPGGGLCSCGCGEKLTGRRTRWATTECGEAAYQEYAIRSGQSSSIRWSLWERDAGVCARCGEAVEWEADHILPVHRGGGGCGLDGFQTLCLGCHKAKTREDAQRATW